MVDKLEPRDFKIILIGRSVFLAFPTWYLFESTFVESGKKTGPFHDWHYKLFKLFSWVRVMSLIYKGTLTCKPQISNTILYEVMNI